MVLHRVSSIAKRLDSNTSLRAHTPDIPPLLRQLSSNHIYIRRLLRALPLFHRLVREVRLPQHLPKRIRHDRSIRATKRRFIVCRAPSPGYCRCPIVILGTLRGANSGDRTRLPVDHRAS